VVSSAAPQVSTPAKVRADLKHTILSRMWKDKVARAALIGLFLLYFSALFADVLTPYGMEFNDANVGNAPATLLHVHNDNGELCCPMFIQ
jgi:hypothetical protein